MQEGQVDLETEIGPEAARLEFWLYFKGPGRLRFHRVELSRPGGWPDLAARAATQFLRQPFWAWWSNEPFQGPWRNRPLREVVRRVSLLELTRRLTGDSEASARNSLRLFRFAADRLGGFPGRFTRPNLGNSAWDVLMRGGGQCDEQAVVLGRLLACLGVTSRVLSGSFEPAAPGGHSILEAFPPTGPPVFDPYLRLCFRGSDGSPAGLRALRSRPGILEKNPRFSAAQTDFKAKVRAIYRNPLPQLAVIKPMSTDYDHLPGFVRDFWAEKIIRRYLGDLERSLASDPASGYLAKARVLHLLGRLEPARKNYLRALHASSLPDHRRAVRSYLAWLALDRGRGAEACKLAAGLKGSANDLWAERAEILAERAGCATGR